MNMGRKRMANLATALIFVLASCVAAAHDNHNKQKSHATYLGNAGILVQGQRTKLLFDPFFHKDFSIYQLVPESIRQAIFQGAAPYNNIDYVFISHAHDDHFSAKDVLNYLTLQTQVQLVAPKQAIDKLTKLSEYHTNAASILPRLHAVSLNYGDMAWSKTINNTHISAVRIPHSGWPSRASVENIVFRVTLADGSTVMHMGDADPDDDHYLPHKAHWQQQVTDTAFPPYWFFYSAEGRDILDEIINAEQHIGVHVPVEVPKRLASGEKLFFSKPGQTAEIQRH